MLRLLQLRSHVAARTVMRVVDAAVAAALRLTLGTPAEVAGVVLAAEAGVMLLDRVRLRK